VGYQVPSWRKGVSLGRCYHRRGLQVTLQKLLWTFCAHLSWTSHFQIWRHRMASKITRLIVVWFLPVGYLKSVVYCAPTPRTTQELKLRIQEEISRIPVDVLRRAMSSVHDRLAECEQRNGGHLEDVIFRVEWCVVCVFFYVQCYVSRPLIHLFLQMLKYVLPYKCKVKLKLKSLRGAFQHYGLLGLWPLGLLYSYPWQVPAFISSGDPHHTAARDLYQRRRELIPPILLSDS
jgi:hypothetical protein